MPIYPYAAAYVTRRPWRHRKLLLRALIVAGFLMAVVLAVALRGL